MAASRITVRFSDAALADLGHRLAHVRWPDEPPGASWEHGTSLAYLRTLVTYWREQYDWRAREALLNTFEHYTAPIQGIDLHFIHERGVGPAPLPLLLLHGWPSSVFEFTKIIPLLTDPARFGGHARDAFTVVAPSLPGYGLSYREGQPRLSLVQMATALVTLMGAVLDYQPFVAHGGDWGAHILSRMGIDHAACLQGLHLSMLVIEQRSAATSGDALALRAASARWRSEEGGYALQQATRPQTLAYGLTDSPVGLAAWMIEKLRAWSDCHGDIERRFTKDELLDTVMLYWLTNSINSSFWPYRARQLAGRTLASDERVRVPTAYAESPIAPIRWPRTVAQDVYDIRRWTRLPAGGHFPAFEEPQALAADIREFFRPLRDA